MTSSKNPFYQWLGISARRPNYYKLLGVPRSADRKQIKLAAQARLGQLQAVDSGEDAAGLKQVQAAVEKALRVLSDPKRRKEYDQKLEAAEQKRAGQKGEPKADRTGPRRAGPNYSQDDLLPPTSSKADGPREPDNRPPGAEPSPTAVDTPVAQPVAQPVETKPDGPIPMAVPLQAPTESPSQPPSPPQAENESVGSGTSWRDSDDYDPISGLKKKNALSGKFRVRSRGKRQGKRSIMVPLLSMFFFVVGIAGLLYFLFAYLEMNGGAIMTADGPNVTAGDGQLGGETGGETGGAPGDEGKDNSDPADQGSESPEVPPNDSKSEGAKPAEKVAGVNGADAGKPGDTEQPPPKTDDGSSQMPKDAKDTDEPSEPEDRTAEPRSLNFQEKAQFRRLIQRADRKLYQRDLESALETARQAAALLEPGPEAGPLDEEGQALGEMGRSVVKMSENLQGFWQQVIQSGRENDGDIPIGDDGDRFVTVVESGDDYIIIRSAGANLRYLYREMPAGLAMDLADSGKKEDVPTWNVQKATFYAVYRRVDLKYGDRALEFIRSAEQDGHELGYLRQYLRGDFSAIGRPTAPVRELAGERLQREVRDLKKSLDIPSRVRALSPPECAKLAAAAEVEMDRLPEEQNLQRAAICEIIRELAVQAGDTDLALESITEQRFWAKVDTLDLTVETLNDLAGQKLDRQNARLCIDSYLRFRKSSQDDVAAGSKIRKLHQRIETLAKEAGLTDLSRQLAQIQ